MDFSQIVLSRKEEAALKKLSKKDLQSSSIQSKILDRLIDLDFAQYNFAVQTEFDVFQGNTDEICISKSGQDYLMWLRQKKGEKRQGRIRYIITTVIAVAALVLSLAALLWQAYTWKYELHRKAAVSSSPDVSASVCSFSCLPDETPSAEELQEPPKQLRQLHLG